MNAPRKHDEPAFDRWLRGSLQERYAETLREPVPDALLRMLQDVRE